MAASLQGNAISPPFAGKSSVRIESQAKIGTVETQETMKDRALTMTPELPPVPGRGDARKSAEMPKSATAHIVAMSATISADRNEIRSGDSITLQVTLENGGGATLDVPEKLRLGDGLLRIRVIDSKWKETLIGPTAGTPMPQEIAMKPLGPGQKRTYTIKLTAAEAAFLKTPGQYHVFVDGGVFGAAQGSNRILIRVN